jgi:hypothetical protein
MATAQVSRASGRGREHTEPADRTEERDMAGKNKGGREVRKPKQAKKPKTSNANPSLFPTSERAAKDLPAKNRRAN